VSVIPRPAGQARTVLEMFEHAVTEFPDAVAFRRKNPEGHGLWHYREVRDYVRKFSGALLELGVKPGERVVILSDNRPEWGVAWFSIVSVGAVAVPLDRMQPPDEIARYLTASKARFVVAPAAFTKPLLELLAEVPRIEKILSMEEPKGSGRRIGYEELLGLGEKSGRTYHEVTIAPDDLVTIVTTSGTTGAPRPVRITHANLAFEVGSLEQLDPYARDDGLLSLTPMNQLHEFVSGFLRPFVAGATVGYIHSLAPSGVLEVLEEFKVTRLVGVPQLFTLLADELATRVEKLPDNQRSWVWRSLDVARSFKLLGGFGAGKLFRDVDSAFGGRLRRATVIGARMEPEVVERLLEAGFPLQIGYGLTEASSVTTLGMAGQIPLRSVGKAIPGVSVTIRDPGADGIGEILVSGPNVTPGYDGEPERTARLVVDGKLRTGDVGYMDPDGCLFLKGRRREVIVAKDGRWMFPDDLEVSYAGLPLVREHAVVAKNAASGRGQVPALVVVPDRNAPDAPRSARALEKQIREAAVERAKTLPAAEAAQDVVFVEGALPRTTSLKVRRGELSALIDREEGPAKGVERRRKMRPTVTVLGTPQVDVNALARLFEGHEHTAGRSGADLARMLEGSTANVSVWASGELIGYGRALSDGAFLATLADLVVSPEWQRMGIGSLIVNRLLAHPAVKKAERVVWAGPAAADFLDRFGFEPVDALFVKE
jgi:long-chain acyl-CoA synthetase